MSWMQALKYLSMSALAGSQPTGTGRPIYPYPLLTTRKEQADAVKARQAKNRRKAARTRRRIDRAYARSSGPSRYAFVDR